jgi:transposase
MPQRFIDCDREQEFLLPPSLLEWVAADHLVWTIVDSVAELDLSEFYAAYRWDGRGRPAYDPRMMARFCVTRTHAGFARPEGSSGRAWRTSRSG